MERNRKKYKKETATRQTRCSSLGLSPGTLELKPDIIQTCSTLRGKQSAQGHGTILNVLHFALEGLQEKQNPVRLLYANDAIFCTNIALIQTSEPPASTVCQVGTCTRVRTLC